MKKLATMVVGITFLAGSAALAGINPAAPGLPMVSDATFSSTVANNQISSMCVDCHTVNPKQNQLTGTHYINVRANGTTQSGGSGIDAAGANAVRDNGAYFKISNWVVDSTENDEWPSKYGNAYVSTVNQAPVLQGTALTAGRYNAATASITTSMDIICESCHNIVGNMDGGNNLLSTMANNNWQTAAEATLCVGCHGFMYTANADAVNTSENPNYSDAGGRNTNELASPAKKGNNEIHWVRGTAYSQNHHIMTGDKINATTAGAGILWTDNLIVSYTETCNNTSTLGTYPQRAPWTAPMVKPTTAANLSCTNCHSPAHGGSGSPAASILRGATYNTAAAAVGGFTPAAPYMLRISDRAASSYKRIDDITYCNKCHT